MTRVGVALGLMLTLALPAGAAEAPHADAVRAAELLEAGDVDAARQLAEPLGSGPAADALALRVLGRIARREGRVDDAVSLLEAAVAAEPTSGDSHVHLGGAYVDKLRSMTGPRRLTWARKLGTVVQRAVDLDPTSCEARRSLAEFYLEAPRIAGGSPERARTEAAQLRDRCAAHGHLAFALAAQTLGDLPAAEAAGVAALRAEPDRGEGFALIGWIVRLQDLRVDAPPPEGIRELLAAAPEWHRALYVAGRKGSLPGVNIEKAESALRAAIARERAPAAKALRYWALGLAHQIRGDGDAAWREYTAALVLLPDLELAVKGRESLRPGGASSE